MALKGTSPFQALRFIPRVHVRRGDKIVSEAKAHDLHEYMEHVATYFSERGVAQDDRLTRKVFLASDDAQVLSEAQSR